MAFGNNNSGTVIRPEAPEMEHIVVRAAALAPSEARFTVRDVPDKPGVVYGIFSRLAAANIVVDMIVGSYIAEFARTGTVDQAWSDRIFAQLRND